MAIIADTFHPTMKARYICKRINAAKDSGRGRIIILTGARQTGKTTIAKLGFGDYAYLSIEDPANRPQFAAMTAAQWRSLYPKAILDEIQKEPRLIESIKSVYDQWDEPRYLMTGSSQIQPLEKVRESLVGRCQIFDIYPLTLPELETESWDETVAESAFQQLLTGGKLSDQYPSFTLDPSYAKKMKAWAYYQKFGGYPALSSDGMDDEERYGWLSEYVRTYLERDVRDLASLRDLESYTKLQQAVALQTGGQFNISSLSKRLGINAKTVKKYMQYLEISYQTISLPAWERNESRRLTKSPKIHYLDYGVLQAVVGRRGTPSGNEFESMIIAEMYKQAKQIGIPVNFHHMRTANGIEVDCLLECQDGYYAFEVKQSDKVNPSDARHLSILKNLLDRPLLHAFVVSNDIRLQEFTPDITAIHAAALLG